MLRWSSGRGSTECLPPVTDAVLSGLLCCGDSPERTIYTGVGCESYRGSSSDRCVESWRARRSLERGARILMKDRERPKDGSRSAPLRSVRFYTRLRSGEQSDGQPSADPGMAPNNH